VASSSFPKILHPTPEGCDVNPNIQDWSSWVMVPEVKKQPKHSKNHEIGPFY